MWGTLCFFLCLGIQLPTSEGTTTGRTDRSTTGRNRLRSVGGEPQGKPEEAELEHMHRSLSSSVRMAMGTVPAWETGLVVDTKYDQSESAPIYYTNFFAPVDVDSGDYKYDVRFPIPFLYTIAWTQPSQSCAPLMSFNETTLSNFEQEAFYNITTFGSLSPSVTGTPLNTASVSTTNYGFSDCTHQDVDTHVNFGYSWNLASSPAPWLWDNETNAIYFQSMISKQKTSFGFIGFCPVDPNTTSCTSNSIPVELTAPQILVKSGVAWQFGFGVAPLPFSGNASSNVASNPTAVYLKMPDNIEKVFMSVSWAPSGGPPYNSASAQFYWLSPDGSEEPEVFLSTSSNTISMSRIEDMPSFYESKGAVLALTIGSPYGSQNTMYEFNWSFDWQLYHAPTLVPTSAPTTSMPTLSTMPTPIPSPSPKKSSNGSNSNSNLDGVYALLCVAGAMWLVYFAWQRLKLQCA